MKNETIHYPRLDTILRVEELLKNAEEAISKNEIDRRLQKKIMRPTLNTILHYLEQSGKIIGTKQGILWIYKDDVSQALKKRLEKSVNIKIHNEKRSHYPI